MVEIEFSTNGKEYKIIRGIKPNIFEIYVNDIKLNKDAIKDDQAFLEKTILGMNFKSFTQIVILGSASFTPFMQLVAADRRAVIEDLLDIQVFSVMNILAKAKLTANKEDYAKNALELKSATEKKGILERTLAGLRQNVDEKIAQFVKDRNEYEENLKVIHDDLERLKKTRAEYAAQITGLDDLRNRHAELITIDTKLKHTLAAHLKDVSFYEHNDNCPTCAQAIDKAFKENVLGEKESLISSTKVNLTKLASAIDSTVTKIALMTDILVKNQDVSSQIITLSEKASYISKNIASIDSSIGKLETSDKLLLDNTVDLEETVRELGRLEKEKASLLEERQYLEVAINLLKDGGIKTKIIKQYLPIINKSINKYLSAMGFFIDFNIDENFEETIKSRFRDEFSYANFSEGEKDRIDLAILFTWRHIAKMKNSVHTNLLILDEIFDGSLDANGTDEFLKIMQSLTADTNTIVISHKIDAMLDKFEKVYNFQKRKNFSVLVDSDKDAV